jgi:Phytanoyl-CoA dioxygenase (PhyH)
VLLPRERDEFERTGLLRLSQAVPAADVAVMRDRFWDFLGARFGMAPDRPETWRTGTPRHLQALRRSGAFAAMATPAVRAALDDLLGPGGWEPPKAWGLPLVTFPGVQWAVPSSGWHVDSYGPEHDLPGVTVFVFLAEVARRGGGTAVLAGSHRLVNRHIASTGSWRPAEIKAALYAAHPWLASPDADRPLVAGDVTVRLEELTGAPGDVMLMHSRTLHAAAPNAAPAPRMLLVEIVNRA